MEKKKMIKKTDNLTALAEELVKEYKTKEALFGKHDQRLNPLCLYE